MLLSATDSDTEEYPQSLPRGGEDERLDQTHSTTTTRLVQSTLTGTKAEVKCRCGKVCKNLRGLRIHQGRTACGSTARQRQRSDFTSGETLEDPSQDSTHSTGDLYAAEKPRTNSADPDIVSQVSDIFEEDDPLLELLGTPEDLRPNTDTQHNTRNTASNTNATAQKVRITWPKTSDRNLWKQFDEDLNTILETTLQGPVEKKLKSLTNLVHSIGKERFGEVKRKPTRTPAQPNRRQRQITEIRKELKSLRKSYQKANIEERPGLQQLRDELRQKLTDLRKAEQLRDKRKKRAKRRAEFIANPYKFSKGLLDKEKSGKLESSMEEIQQHLKDTHSDPARDNPLGSCPRIEPVPEPTIPLNIKEPTMKEVSDVVKKARSGSAPGPNGIPYKVYKMCPMLLRRLWTLLKVIWRKGKVPDCWQQAEGIFTPKEKGSKHVTEFRTISLLNVEGKIFFADLARRMTTFLTTNQYIDTSIIREAKVNANDLTVVWLDLANAYGSIPHKLIEEAMKHYHIPEHIQGIINGYFDGIQPRFSIGDQTTPWQRLEKGIVTGCTISVVLFVMGMNLIINAAKRETRGPKTASGIHLPSSRGFMDDLTITTTTHVQARWVLTALQDTVTWARMKFKPKKSRSLIIKKGKVTKRFTLQVQGEDIPSIIDSPVKCLGKWYDASLKDTNNITRVKNQLQDGLKLIDQTGLPGKFEAWLYQHGLLPRLMWPLMLYEIATTTVEGFERVINRHLRRWLGVPPSFTSIGLYGRTKQLQLPMTSLVEEFKVAKGRLVVTLKESSDDMIWKAGIETRTGRKWSASQAVAQAESRLRHKDIVGTTAIGRQGLGSSKPQRWSTAGKKERSQMVQYEIRLSEEEDQEEARQSSRDGRAVRMDTTADHRKTPDMGRHLALRTTTTQIPTEIRI
ncbi:uncharacterized protein LOC127870041 [Dreissena polymorpha]|uniref:uncharacterized protein LOC127870041 n=1 Tax=Dreissena polymorpha TaxID=45954 RepID=UPI00226518DB|nr:uncharacterized protein LOC127870041 [Dreissena polymorpha]